jgi:hypothetical protein
LNITFIKKFELLLTNKAEMGHKKCMVRKLGCELQSLKTSVHNNSIRLPILIIMYSAYDILPDGWLITKKQKFHVIISVATVSVFVRRMHKIFAREIVLSLYIHHGVH